MDVTLSFNPWHTLRVFVAVLSIVEVLLFIEADRPSGHHADPDKLGTWFGGLGVIWILAMLAFAAKGMYLS